MKRISIIAFLLIASGAALHADTKTPPYLGIDFRFHREQGRTKYLHVERVAPKGPADRAGIRPGDLVTHLAGTPVGFGDELDFLLFMRDRKPGERLVMSIIREGRPLKLVAVLGTLPESARAAWEQGIRIAHERRRAGARRR